MIELSHYRAIVFDCDGVILDSNGLKSEAFRISLADEPAERIETMLTYHRGHGGLHRKAKFEHYYRDIVGREGDITEDVERALERFAVASRERLTTCQELPGIRDVLWSLRQRGVPSFVMSGAEEAEVVWALEHHGLAPYFDEILGGPTPKHSHMQRLIDGSAVVLPAVFFGDARLDMETADRAGLDFVFVAAASDWGEGRRVCAQRGIPTIEDFRGLAGHVG